MKVTKCNLPQLVKIGNVPAGKLVQPYDEHLNPRPFVMVIRAFTAPQDNGWNSEVHVVDLESGIATTLNGSTRCSVFHGAVVVLDFVEGERAD